MTDEQRKMFVPSSALPPAWVCQVCGAAVLDYGKHERWHRESLTDTPVRPS